MDRPSVLAAADKAAADFIQYIHAEHFLFSDYAVLIANHADRLKAAAKGNDLKNARLELLKVLALTTVAAEYYDLPQETTDE